MHPSQIHPVTIAIAAFVALVAIFVWLGYPHARAVNERNALPHQVTMEGTYLCVPRLPGQMTNDLCVPGLQTDDGTFYLVDFGQASTTAQFERNARVAAEGFLTPKEALNSDHWWPYDFTAVFTITKLVTPSRVPAMSGKLDIGAVCRSALAYTTFTDGAAADAFVADCIAGKHPEVIERYKKDMNLGDGAAI